MVAGMEVVAGRHVGEKPGGLVTCQVLLEHLLSVK